MHQKSHRAKLEYGRPISSIFIQLDCTTIWRRETSESIKQESCAIAKATSVVDHAMRPIYVCPENFRDSLTMPTATFHKFFVGHLLQSTLWMCTQNSKSVALPVPEIIGGTKKFWGVSHYTHAHFSLDFFNRLLFGWTLWMYLPNLKTCS